MKLRIKNKILKVNYIFKKLCFAIISIFPMFVHSQAQLVPFKFSEESQKWGYKNKFTNEIIIYWHFDNADSFNKEGLAKATYQNKQGCIDTSGKIIIPFFFKQIISCHKDTVLLAQKGRMLINIRNDYFEFQKGIRLFDFPVNQWPKSKFNIIKFSYPRDQTIIQNKINQSREEDIQPRRNILSSEISYSSLCGYSKELSLGSKTYWPINSNQIRYTKWINLSEPKQNNTYIGIGTGFISSKYWVDTAVIKSDQLFIGISHKIYFNESAYFQIGAYPIINQITKSHKRGEAEWNHNNLNYSLSANFESSINFCLSKNSSIGLGFKYLPTPYYRAKLQRNYLSINIGILF